jgi:hypothetical protein
MNILYGGRYKGRFYEVIEQIKDLPANSQILELCFGDTYIADYCKKNGHRWKGIDLNKHFVRNAQKLGYDASYDDLASRQELPKANVCIMVGSLYHFYPDTLPMLSKMVKAANTIIISEPVSNLSNRKGIIGFLAKRSASVGQGHETFRYDAVSFPAMINEYSAILNYTIVSTQRFGKDLIIKIIKNGSV